MQLSGPHNITIPEHPTTAPDTVSNLENTCSNPPVQPAELAALTETLDTHMSPPINLSTYDDDTVIASAQQFARHVADVSENRRRVGQLAADLRRRGFKWKPIADLTELPLATVYRLAQPFLGSN
jgi:hypothetical protein